MAGVEAWQGQSFLVMPSGPWKTGAPLSHILFIYSYMSPYALLWSSEQQGVFTFRILQYFTLIAVKQSVSVSLFLKFPVHFIRKLYMILHYVILHYIYYDLFYSTIYYQLYYIILYYNIVWYISYYLIILYYTILYYVSSHGHILSSCVINCTYLSVNKICFNVNKEIKSRTGICGDWCRLNSNSESFA